MLFNRCKAGKAMVVLKNIVSLIIKNTNDNSWNHRGIFIFQFGKILGGFEPVRKMFFTHLDNRLCLMIKGNINTKGKE